MEFVISDIDVSQQPLGNLVLKNIDIGIQENVNSPYNVN